MQSRLDLNSYILQAGLELMILLPQSSECWYYQSEPPHLDLLNACVFSKFPLFPTTLISL
jgi:hypothetical protein